MKIVYPFFNLFLILLLFSSCAYAQAQNGDIILEKRLGTYQFYQDDKKLSFRQVIELMKVHPESYDYIKTARRAYVWSSITGFIGGFLIGYPVGTAIGGGDPEWGMAGAGAGVVVVSIILDSKFKKNVTQALSMYNARQQN